MKSQSALIVGGAGVLAAVAVWTATSSAAQTAPQAAAASASSADDEGKTLFETQCSNCHELRIATSQRKSADDWTVTVDSMVTKGAPISQEQADQIIAYLAKTYGLGGN